MITNRAVKYSVLVIFGVILLISEAYLIFIANYASDRLIKLAVIPLYILLFSAILSSVILVLCDIFSIILHGLFLLFYVSILYEIIKTIPYIDRPSQSFLWGPGDVGIEAFVLSFIIIPIFLIVFLCYYILRSFWT